MEQHIHEVTCCVKNTKISLIPKMALFTRIHSVISKFLQILYNILYNEGLFEGCSSLTHVSIPSSITSIEDNEFKGCSSLIQILIPTSITSIGESAFYGCSSLKQITIPTSVTSIGNGSFLDVHHY